MADLIARLTTALAGRYTIQRELGAGGMATVYLAEDLRHHRQVAVKVLREDLAASVGPERFQREIEIAARLTHPHILPLYDSGEANGFLFYVMPYVEGESLRDRISREGELPVADAVRILREVADALAKAHSQGVVHRDIKPDNVMLADRHALVADFGVAKAVSSAAAGMTTVGVALGTPAYMAPEQAAADPNTDHRADIYAFGALAYEMLTGAPPFTGNTAQQVLAAHMTEAPQPVTTRRQTVPPALAELVMRCLEKKPADRWQSAAELVSKLETIATPSGGMEPTRPLAAMRTGGSRRWMLGVGALVVGVGVWAVAFRGPKGPGLDPDLVMVLPFRVASASSDLSYLREGVVDIMATLLTGEGGTARAAEPSTVIAGWRKRVASDNADLDAAGAEALARELGAGSVLSGSIIGSESKLTVRASLSTVGSRSEPLQVSVDGSADSLSALLQQVAGRLLARSAGVDADLSANLLTNSLPALRAYLRGQALYRQGEYTLALPQFSEALRADSNFGMAGAGFTATIGWIGGAPAEIVGLAQRAAWRNRDRLGVKDRALVVARLGPNGPDPDWVSDELRAAQQGVEIAGDRAEAWYLLGDEYLHSGALLGIDDAMEQAEIGLRRALERDSLDAGVLGHLILLAARRQDSTEVRRILKLRERAVADPMTRVEESYIAATFLGDSAARRRLLALLDTASISNAVDFVGPTYTASFLPGHLGELREYAALLARRAATTDDRSYLSLLRAMLAWDAGRPTEAAQLVGSETQADVFRVLAALFWSGDSIDAATAARRLAVAPSPLAPAGFAAASPACVLGLWEQAHGAGGGGMAARIMVLREAAGARDPSWPPDPNQLCALVLEAGAAQLAGDPRAGAMVDSLNATLLRGPGLGTTWQNLAVAGMLERKGDYLKAAAAARRTRHYWGYVPFLASYYRESGRLAELAGDRDRAIEGYARYLDLRKDAEPSMQPEIDRVRQAMVRLTAEGR